MSSKYRCVNFYDLCRLCTACSDEKLDIFSAEGKSKNLSAKITECLLLVIDEKDHLPKVLCPQCVQHVENIAEFRNTCRRSQAMLSCCLSTATQQQTGGKVYIKDNVATGIGKSQILMPGKTETVVTSQQPQYESTLVNQVATSSTQKTSNFLNSFIHPVAVQSADSGNSQQVQQYTITLDNSAGIKREPIEFAPPKQHAPTVNTTSSDIDSKHNALEEFLRMKPNIKVTPIKKKQQQQQQQPVIHQQQMHPEVAAQAAVQQEQTEQSQIAQLQLQQLQQQIQQQLQQQWQQQQLQQQLQQITAQLQTASQQQPITISDALSPGKNKKPKLNFVLTSPQNNEAAMPQITPSSAVASQPQIQLQFQPSTSISGQPSTTTATTTLLQNLAPFLQSQTQQSNNNMLSSSNCFLPITIKDENSDQQIVAHIDAKNFVLPTTYQLQMKLQPQIQTVDGQPIMQLTPTSIPATLQLTPQALGNQTFQTAAATNTQQMQLQQETTTSAMQQQTKQHPQAVEITSQQILNMPAKISALNEPLTNHTHDAATSTNDPLDITADFVKEVMQQQNNNINTQSQKYRLTQTAAKNMVAIEITPTTNFTQQIMQQVQQQQKQRKIKQEQQMRSSVTTTTTTLPTQHGGITVQRITTTKASAVARTQYPKLPVLNKQNVTISRIPAPQQQPSQNNESPTSSSVQPQVVKQEHVSIVPNQTTVAKLPVAPSSAFQTTSKGKTTSPRRASVRSCKPAAAKPSAATTNNNNSTGTTIVSSHAASGVGNQQQQPQSATDSNPTSQTLVITGANNTTSVAAHGVGADGLQCSQCGRLFKKKEFLMQHVKLHAGVRPFKCTEEGCSKDFSRKEHLLRHIVSHTGRKMFSCDVCEKLFSRKDNLNKHKRIHTDHSTHPGKYICEICHKSFAVQLYYEQHKLIHEKGKPTKIDYQKPKLKPFSEEHQQAKLEQEIRILQQQQTQQPLQQQPQIMHLQLPTALATSQGVDTNIITITQANDPNNSNLKAFGNHAANVLNLPTSLANFVQLGQAQFVNATTGEILGQIKLEK